MASSFNDFRLLAIMTLFKLVPNMFIATSVVFCDTEMNRLCSFMFDWLEGPLPGAVGPV